MSIKRRAGLLGILRGRPHRGAVDPAGNPVVYLSLPDAQEVLYQQDSHASVAARTANAKRLERAGYAPAEAAKLAPLLSGSTATVNAVLVKIEAGADLDSVAGHIERWLHFNAYTTAEERDLVLEGRLKKMSAVLGRRAHRGARHRPWHEGDGDAAARGAREALGGDRGHA